MKATWLLCLAGILAVALPGWAQNDPLFSHASQDEAQIFSRRPIDRALAIHDEALVRLFPVSR